MCHERAAELGTLGLTGRVPIAPPAPAVTVRGMSYPSDLTGEQWELLEPVFNNPGKRGPQSTGPTCAPSWMQARVYALVGSCVYLSAADPGGRALTRRADPSTLGRTVGRQRSRNSRKSSQAPLSQDSLTVSRISSSTSAASTQSG